MISNKKSWSSQYFMNTVNVEFSRGGNFHDIAFFAKISPARKFNPYDFIEEIGVVS